MSRPFPASCYDNLEFVMSATPPPAPAPYIAEIKELLLAELNLPNRRVEDLDETAPLFGAGGLGLDSIDALQIAMGVEERFGVRLPDGDGAKEVFASIRSLASFVANAKAGSS